MNPEISQMLSLEGKAAIVTGGAMGIGQGIALRLAQADASVVIADINDDAGNQTVEQIRRRVAAVKQLGDVVVASVHWGGNWGYPISPEQRKFAHRLIDKAGIAVIHGHSSHHVKGIEVYKEKLILYGCGDFLNDYEGIGGYEEFRGDLALMYFATVAPATGNLLRLQMTPTQTRRFKVNRASLDDARWLRETLNREGAKLGTRTTLDAENRLLLHWR